MTFHPDSNLPDCMLPDGGDCCAGYQALLAEWRRLVRSSAASATPTGCVCQDQHRRGYCTEPGCPYSDPEIMKSRDEAATPSEPVAWQCRDKHGHWITMPGDWTIEENVKGYEYRPLYTTPQPVGVAQPKLEPARADEDQVKDLILKHCTVNEQKVLLRTIWKGGIYPARPRICIMNIADELLALPLSSTNRETP